VANSVTPFLMFEKGAEEAMKLYISLFTRSEVLAIERYGPEGPGAEGSVKRADFTLAGQRVICIDSPVKHQFGFTPSVSLFVECESELELDEVFKQLSSGGVVMMAPDNYGFSKKFVWFNDRFGVSWQLNFQG
jgi:predicted 3-demethylubiquinone-9 3-methyltransferase (glyoxalase superfamily)